MNNVISLSFQGNPVRFNGEGWINATEVAKRFGKKPIKWLELPSTKSYMAAMLRRLSNEVRESDLKLVETVRGRGKAGTWLHPKLGVRFAQWLDDDFAVWCDEQIDALLRGETSLLARFNQVCKRLDDRQARASLAGKELNGWKCEKPRLIAEVERGRQLLQMTLGLNAPDVPLIQAGR
ncbi:DNA-binding protein [Pseudomonas plecoglossicida]|uniref:DNA-binding protein n=1 Tax=Pseudomonas plecoglossicida TaxID=70775 RepID=A0A0B5KLQ7_PSEDL|nr:KilA-N domain-containing protein [Pseudomonas plecoglossicida]AJG17305.1 hypothetical protein RK21_05797 [Pseudomonas plecoglossicida]PBJ97523.1 DNA-binding protein [Pseudomonas plecoglossicida]